MLKLSTSVVKIGSGTRVDIGSVLSHWWNFAALLAVVAVYYLFLLSNGTFQLFAPEMLGRVFNNMLVHLLHGEFTVDREAIGFEAFTRNGNTYAYFGVFPALLRLVAIPSADIAQVELARLSCLTAVVIFVALQLRMLLIVHDSLPAGRRAPNLLAVMVAATILSGPQVYMLSSAWVYHEPILWSAAIAAAFNLVVVRAAFGESGLRGRDLVSLATLAGLAINTRASVGPALYLGTILLVAWAALCRHAPDPRERPLSPRGRSLLTAISALARDPCISLPIVVLGLLAVSVGMINFKRWGNPFTFADFQYWDFAQSHPKWADVIRNYGEFNLGRVWIGGLYYTTGIPYLLMKVVPSFDEFLRARYTGIEAPPCTGLITNPLTILLAGFGLYRLCWKPELPAGCLSILRLALIGNAFAILVMFAFMHLALRYRFDFAPFMTLAALIGYR